MFSQDELANLRLSLDKMLRDCKINSLRDFLRVAICYEMSHVRSDAARFWSPRSPFSLP